MPQDLASDLLRSTIEETVGRKLRTPKDFGILADLIFEKLHERISPTTLKRFWGYLHDVSSTPRQSTLDLLAQFIDYPSFAAFAEAHTTTTAEASAATAEVNTTTETQATPSPAVPPTAVDDSISDTSTSSSPSHRNTSFSSGASTPPSAHKTPFFTQLSSFVTHHSSQAKRPFGPSASFVIFLALLAIAVPFAIHHFRAPSPTSYISAPSSPTTRTTSAPSASSPISSSPTTHNTLTIPTSTSGDLNTTTPYGTTTAIQQP